VKEVKEVPPLLFAWGYRICRARALLSGVPRKRLFVGDLVIASYDYKKIKAPEEHQKNTRRNRRHVRYCR
jgi:hypothetical protein